MLPYICVSLDSCSLRRIRKARKAVKTGSICIARRSISLRSRHQPRSVSFFPIQRLFDLASKSDQASCLVFEMRYYPLVAPLILLLTLSPSTALPIIDPHEIDAVVFSAAAGGACAIAVCLLRCCILAARTNRERRHDMHLIDTAATAMMNMQQQAQQGPLRAGTRVVLGMRRGPEGARPRPRVEVVHPEGPGGGRVAVRGGCSGGDCGRRVGRSR